MESLAILLLAYGGPNSLDDVPAFLRNVRGGQPVPQPLIDEITRRYRLIGGRSPLLNITRRLAAKLQIVIGLPVYVGMRHWHPFIADAVHAIACDGIDGAVVICMTPHFSSVSVGAYRAALEETTRNVIARRRPERSDCFCRGVEGSPT
ncbi:MAG: ferrochelatase, partial [Chloroflexota bacterium]